MWLLPINFLTFIYTYKEQLVLVLHLLSVLVLHLLGILMVLILCHLLPLRIHYRSYCPSFSPCPSTLPHFSPSSSSSSFLTRNNASLLSSSSNAFVFSHFSLFLGSSASYQPLPPPQWLGLIFPLFCDLWNLFAFLYSFYYEHYG